jgi:hypothetical protein
MRHWRAGTIPEFIYRTCPRCGGASYKWIELPFKTGSVEPAEDEVLTGGNSGNYGTVEKVRLESGTWAGGDAAGHLWLSSVSGTTTGYILTAFEENETVTGGSGAALVAADVGYEKVFGMFYPERDMVKMDGIWYCQKHYHMIYDLKWRREAKLHVKEESWD